MALTNAQRQARHRARLKQKAAGVTADMVRRAAMLEYMASRDSEDPEWNDLLRHFQKKGNRTLWTQYLPHDPTAEYDEYGTESELMRSVAKVVHAVTVAPEPEFSGQALRRQRRSRS